MSIDARVEAERLLQEGRRRWFVERCGREPWFTAWQYVYEEDERMGWLSCYLVSVGDSAAQLSSPDYGRIPDTYAPGFDESEDGYRYERYGNSDGYEPLVHRRSWDGLHPKETEVVEEYRLFHNLFRTSDGNLARVSTDGATDETVVRFTEAGAVEFLLGPLRQYLAAKQCTLVACIDWREFAHTDLTAIGVDDEADTFQSGDSIYRIAFGDRTFGNAFSRLLGKKVIEPPPVERSGVWPYEEEQAEDYPEFIIGVDEHGDPISYSCEPDGLGTYFDRDPRPERPALPHPGPLPPGRARALLRSA